MLPGVQYILGTMFQEVGVRVHYSQIDNDDTLASYAQKHGASILSGDRDFFRYREMSYTVYSGFEVKGEKLCLKKRGFVLHKDPRSLILDPLPPTYD